MFGIGIHVADVKLVEKKGHKSPFEKKSGG
jgi:hypothetical protein